MEMLIYDVFKVRHSVAYRPSKSYKNADYSNGDPNIALFKYINAPVNKS